MLQVIWLSPVFRHVHIPAEHSLKALRHSSICGYEVIWEQLNRFVLSLIMGSFNKKFSIPFSFD
jgi:hypothetical protein